MNRPAESLLRLFIRTGLFSKLAPNHYQYAEHSMRTARVKGIRMRLDISDYVGHYLYFGFKDPSFSGLMKNVKPGNVILDIGANIGFTALSMAKLSLPNGIVYAFEPDPFNYEQLKHNVFLNTLPNVKIFNVGLGVTKEQLKLAVNTANNRGGNRIRQDASENFNLVDIMPLDEFVSLHGLATVDLVKIDVEGFEYNVLKGAEQLLSTQRPVLFIELDDSNLKEQGASAKELIAWLNALGYTCLNNEEGTLLSPADNFTGCHYDIICKKS
ncbi:MAG: FkbM family methyltransferase [Bacteroidia bacterium]